MRHRPQPDPSPNQVRAMKALLVAMASDRVPPDIRVEETHGTLPLWNEARFSRVRQYEGRGLVGEKYLLQNISDAPMVLAEQEFDREQGSVVGIAVEHHNLRPGESTSVYVIRRGETP
jgi:conjugal transfer pilus assembly protein TraK